MGQSKVFFGNFKVSVRTINVVITWEESDFWDNTVQYGTIKAFFYIYTCVWNGQYTVFLHAWKVTFGTILCKMGQYKTLFWNIKVTKMDNIWCYYMLEHCDFLGQYCPNMGQLKTFCKNIMVTKTDNIGKGEHNKIIKTILRSGKRSNMI